MVNNIIDKITYRLYNFDNIEKKLTIFNGYKRDSIIKWKNSSEISWKLTKKILENLTIYSSKDIRDMLRDIVKGNEELFTRKNLYITSFGNVGKSGDLILYEFTHAMDQFKRKVIETWELTGLPEGSTVIFLDDLIGTGTQSVDFISKKLNLIISPSYDCYLICLCATREGLNKISNETNFSVINSVLLCEDKFEYLNPSCNVFNICEKEKMKDLNVMLKSDSSGDFNKGLLVAFAHCVPNNTMTLIWKDDFNYKDKKGANKKWKAILPRKY